MAKLAEKTMPAVFQNRVAVFGDRSCVSYKKDGVYTDISWKEMDAMVRNIGSFLMANGVKKKDKVAIFSENRYEWWAADLAALSIGATDVPIYATNSSEEAEYVLDHSGSKVCFVSTQDHLDRLLKVKKKLPKLETVVIFEQLDKKKKGVIQLSDAMEEGAAYSKAGDFDKRVKAIVPDDLATLIYTSGTTGNPKGVMLSHGNFAANVKQSINDFQDLVTPAEIFLSFLPLSHSLERTIGFYLPIYQGATVAFVEDVSTTLIEDFIAVRPTAMVSVPRIYEKVHAGISSSVADASPVKKAIFNWAMKTAAKNVSYNCQNKPRKGLFKKRYDLADKLVFSKLKAAIGLDRLKIAISGGGPLSVTDAEFFLGMDLKIYEGFGLTETTPVTNVNLPRLIKPGTVGPPVKDTTVKISDEGEILIKGPQVMLGYYKNKAATDEVFTKDKFFKTGDIGVIDEDGFLAITGRIKDIIVTAGGKNISPQNIEGSLKSSRYIEQVAIIGDRRKFLSALIVPTFEELTKWAKKEGIVFTSEDDLINNDLVNAMIGEEVKKYTQQFARVEQIRKFRLLSSEWSQATGELTPSLKVKRRVIDEKYGNEIDTMYADE